MWQQFWLQNIHYVIEVFVGFLMVTAGWIYLDGWLIERRAKTLIRSIGFFTLTIWSFVDAAPLGINKIGLLSVENIANAVGMLGFGLIFLSLFIDPVPVKPNEKPIPFFSNWWNKIAALFPIPLSSNNIVETLKMVGLSLLSFITTILAILVIPQVWMFVFAAATTFLLWVHYVKGIQSEWKYFYVGFFIISIAIAFSIGSLSRGTSNVLIAEITAPYHLVWILEHITKFIGAIFLGLWAWGFIRFRIFPQLFSSFMALAFIIFVVTTILYTGFLLNRTQESIVDSLKTNIKTMDFALRKVKETSILAARISSSNPQVREAVRRNDKDALFQNLNALMFDNGTDFMIVVNRGGEVLMRAEDRKRFGDSLADDPVVWRALDGKAVVTTFTEPGVTLPTVSIRAASPIVDSSETGDPEITGAVITGFLLDTAFVDGIKKITGLDMTIYANDISSATTFTVPGEQFRLVGIRESNQDILIRVLKKGEAFTGTATILNQPYLAAYIPMQDIEETTVGMFFTGRSQASILVAVSDTIGLTFSISIILMIISIIPIGWLARFISYHQQV